MTSCLKLSGRNKTFFVIFNELLLRYCLTCLTSNYNSSHRERMKGLLIVAVTAAQFT